jgi:hypothetical protein
MRNYGTPGQYNKLIQIQSMSEQEQAEIEPKNLRWSGKIMQQRYIEGQRSA